MRHTVENKVKIKCKKRSRNPSIHDLEFEKFKVNLKIVNLKK